MANTILNKYPYPDEDQDPFYTAIESYFSQTDVGIWNNKLRSNGFMAGGGVISFTPASGLLSWTENFAFKNVHSGFITYFQFGEDGINREINLQDGEILFGSMSSLMGNDETRNLISDSKLPDHTDGYVVLAFRYGDNVFFRNGVVV